MAGLFTQRSMHALSTLSSRSQSSNPIPEKTPSTATTPCASTGPGSTHRPSSAKVRDDNPFLELPARKMYKRDPENASASSLSAAKSTKDTTGHGIFNRPAIGGGQESWKPQRLILTRVLPSNSITRTTEGEEGAADSAAAPSWSVPISAIATASACALPIAPCKPPELERNIDSGFASKSDTYTHQAHAQYPSTTPKAPPSQEYYDFIMKGLSIDTDLKERTNVTRRVDAEDQEMAQKNEGQMYPQQQKEQLEQQESELEDTVPFNSTIMAFARKSIMQHATSSPNSIFRKLNKTAAAATSSSNSVRGLLVSKSNPTSNLAKVPPKSTLTKDHGRLTEKGARDHSRDGIAVPETAFTFVSRPKPTATPAAVPISTAMILATTAATAPAENPKANDAVRSDSGPSGRTTSGTQQSPLLASIFSHSVLDFSQKKSGLSDATAATNAPTSKEAAEFHKPEAFATSTPHLNTSRPEYTIPSMTGTEALMDTNQLAAVFDLRSALRMDSARTQYNLPSLIASLSPPASPKRRPSPYVIPSANERDALRSRRMPSFKARPLNPKVFTSAGDLGVPRIPKQPLTVPRSPVFSKTKTRSAFAEGRLKKEAAMNSMATTRLKNIVKAGTARKTFLGTPSVVSQGPRQFRANPKIMQSQGKMDGASYIAGSASKGAVTATGDGEHQFSASATDSPTKHIPLIVPSVDPNLATIKTHLCSISGPPQREHVPSPTTSPATAIAPSRVKSVTAATVATTKWRRPATKPRPFSFATTELQRRRMLFQPTSDTITGATAAFKPTSSKIPTATRNRSSGFGSRSNALTLEDLES
ncbi:hypothetical protein EDD21DRAFT_378599 [Dissophora ornata]|nr:hypothetical protein BGZ58_010411 [Dissophora ornata]KAI8599901.1 hypothetical protein EDD21DRAFT_378599 [Dissophora ornata]